MTTLPRRLRALFLTLLFLGGGTSLPSLDVLLFHLHGESSQAIAHIETANGCASHAGHCAIGCPAGASGALGARISALLLDVVGPRVVLSSLTQVPILNALNVGFHSRAPPALHV